MKKRKDIIKNIDLETCNKIVDMANSQGLEVIQFDGCLLDDYIIYNHDTLKVGRAIRKYMIIQEYYINEWSSGLKLILTDNNKKVDQFIKEYEKETV